MAIIPDSRISEHRLSSTLPGSACAESDSDGNLLDRFIRERDESAFEELVRRHGSMVLGVCQRVLRNAHDAEDCFQTAFLVLVRKATSIRPRDMVGNWLHGVAYRTALEAKKLAARRRTMERKKTPSEALSNPWQDLQPVLDQEVSRLPEKYRIVLVVCDLEGKTRHEATAQLGLPEGTIASRLARARTLLAKRLARHSLALSATSLAVILSENAQAVCVPPSLIASTVEAAAETAAGNSPEGIVSPRVAVLTETVLQTMMLSKLKIASVVLFILTVLGLGVASFIPSVKAERKPDGIKPNQKKHIDKPSSLKFELAKDCVLQSIDLDNQTIQATSSAGRHDLKVESTTTILIDGEPANLADLQAGVCVNLEFERTAAGRPRAIRIEAVGDVVEGVVQAFNETAVTIESEKDPKAQTYSVDKTAKVVIDGKKAKFTDLKARMKVSLQMSVIKRRVMSIDAKGPKVDGVLKAINDKQRTLSMTIANTDLCAEAITIAEDAPVHLDGKQGKLSDLRAGMHVTVQMSATPDERVVVGITSTPTTRKQ